MYLALCPWDNHNPNILGTHPPSGLRLGRKKKKNLLHSPFYFIPSSHLRCCNLAASTLRIPKWLNLPERNLLNPLSLIMALSLNLMPTTCQTPRLLEDLPHGRKVSFQWRPSLSKIHLHLHQPFLHPTKAENPFLADLLPILTFLLFLIRAPLISPTCPRHLSRPIHSECLSSFQKPFQTWRKLVSQFLMFSLIQMTQTVTSNL